MNVDTASTIADLLSRYKAGLPDAAAVADWTDEALADWADEATRALRTVLSAGESWIDGRDAAFPANLHNWPGLVFGYYGGPLAFNVWAQSAWAAFGSYKVPIWVGGYAGAPEGIQAAAQLRQLGVPQGCETILDMEQRVDRTYVTHFGQELHDAGYRVLVYGSTSTVFKNPQLNGYAVADPTGVAHMYPHKAVRMTQYAFGETFDSDVIKHWIASDGFLWR
jgi:hypothetical protein